MKRGQRKAVIGTVKSDRMNKTITVEAENQAIWTAAEAAMYKKLTDSKGGGIVKAKAGDLITAIMAVSTDEVPKLVEYHKPDHPGKGKLRVSGTVSALRVTRTGRIELMIEGKWEPAPIEKPKPPRR